MSIQIQRRRGTKAENEAFTGALGEFVYETDTKRIAAHDASRAGGFPVQHFQDAQNQSFTFASAGGTATVMTADTAVNPDTLVAGLKVSLKITAASTGAATLQWGSTTAKNIKTLSAGVKADVDTGAWVVGDYVDFIYDGVDYIALSSAGGGAGGLIDVQVFTSSGTWTKPTGCNSIQVEVVGGGGGGGSPTGGSPTGGVSSSFGSHCTGGGALSSGLGGAATDGDLNVFGGDGGTNINVGTPAAGGHGGASTQGGGGRGGDVTATAAQDGRSYGSGGGGGGSTNNIGGDGGGAGATARKHITAGIGATETITVGTGGAGNGTGGDGADGVVIVTSYK